MCCKCPLKIVNQMLTDIACSFYILNVKGVNKVECQELKLNYMRS